MLTRNSLTTCTAWTTHLLMSCYTLTRAFLYDTRSARDDQRSTKTGHRAPDFMRTVCRILRDALAKLLNATTGCFLIVGGRVLLFYSFFSDDHCIRDTNPEFVAMRLLSDFLSFLVDYNACKYRENDR